MVINTDLACGRAMGPDMALSSRLRAQMLPWPLMAAQAAQISIAPAAAWLIKMDPGGVLDQALRGNMEPGH